MKNQTGRVEKLEKEIKEKSLDNGEQDFSGLREFLKKLNPERSRIIDGLFKQYKDGPGLAVQQALRHVDTETLKEIVSILRKKREVSFQVTSS